MLAENILKVKQNIEEVCKKYNLNPKDITIVAASKTVKAEQLAKLSENEIYICGENRVQEFLEKYGKFNTRWHFIGRLQTNKVKYIYDKIELLHSLDRISLADEIEKRCASSNIKLDALVEINIGGEKSKGGIEPQNAIDFYKQIKQDYTHIRICGIMAVLPAASPGDKYYLQMKDIYDKMKNIGGSDIKYLSVGMSDDYLTAIRYGANIIRLGRVLFGERIYK